MSKATDTFTGRDLIAWREEHQLAQTQMNDAVGISRNTVIKYERDDLELPLTERLALAAYESGLGPVARKRAKRR